MAGWSGLSGGARAAVVASGAAVVVGVASLLWPDAPAPEPAAVAALPEASAPAEPAPAAQAPAAQEPVAGAPVPEPAPEVAAVPEPVPPSFDSSRVDALGNAVVAGRADPGAAVAVLVDAAVVADTTAAADGSFAALFTLPPNDKPSLMTLEATLPDGRKVASVTSVALAPIAGPDQVAPAEPPAALLVTKDGVSVVQAPAVAEPAPAEPAPAEPAPAEPAPVQAAAVLIDAISYAPDGAVQVSGKGQGGQAVRVYLDNAAVAEADIPASGGWTATLRDISPGIYTLRVDQLDSAGAVTARFETPFKREAAEALAALTTQDQSPPAAPAAAPEAPSDQAAMAAAPVTPQPPAEPVAPEAPKVAVAAPAADVAAAVAPAQPEPAQVATPAVAAPVAPVTITVQPGFTLWRIARDSFGDGVLYVQVYEANRDKIRDPDLIYPGQVLTLPGNN